MKYLFIVVFIVSSSLSAKNFEIKNKQSSPAKKQITIKLQTLAASVSFKQVDLPSLLNSLTDISKKLDTKGTGIIFKIQLMKKKKQKEELFDNDDIFGADHGAFSKKYSFNFREKTLQQMIQQICKKTGMKYMITDKNVIITDKELTTIKKK